MPVICCFHAQGWEGGERKKEGVGSEGGAANAVAGDAAELGAVLEEDLAGRLRGVDADAVVGEDGGAVPVDAELLGDVLEHGGERRLGRHLQAVLCVCTEVFRNVCAAARVWGERGTQTSCMGAWGQT